MGVPQIQVPDQQVFKQRNSNFSNHSNSHQSRKVLPQQLLNMANNKPSGPNFHQSSNSGPQMPPQLNPKSSMIMSKQNDQMEFAPNNRPSIDQEPRQMRIPLTHGNQSSTGIGASSNSASNSQRFSLNSQSSANMNGLPMQMQNQSKKQPNQKSSKYHQKRNIQNQYEAFGNFYQEGLHKANSASAGNILNGYQIAGS